MFDISNPQKRERLLVIFAGVALCVVVMMVVSPKYYESARLKIDKENLGKKIDEHERHAKNRDEVERRLSAMKNQALASSTPSLESQSISKYQGWLKDLVTSTGFRDVKDGGSPSISGTVKGGYKKHTFSVTGDGRLEQIAEFLRRFHRTEYLHRISSFELKNADQPGLFKVTLRVEALSLPQINVVNVPSLAEIAATDDEKGKLASIRDRAILTEYMPPRPPTPAPPPPAPFDDIPFCFLNAIVEVDGRAQCWIDYRTTGRKYYLFEEGSFTLGGYRCTIKKIDVENQQIVVGIDFSGTLVTGCVKVGKNFDQIEIQE